MNIWTEQEEAERLKERFAAVNRAAFARDHGVKGGQAMIYQHITGRRPISLEAAMAYAKGFGCLLQEISPRLYREMMDAVELSLENDTDSISSWPFKSVNEARIRMLQPHQLRQLEAAMIGALAMIEGPDNQDKSGVAA